MSFLMRNLHRLRYFCADAWDEWRHSFGVNLMALATLTSALFVAGLIILVIANVEREVTRLQDEVRVTVYLQDAHGPVQRDAIMRELSALDAVSRVDLVTKDEALRRYHEFAADMAALVNELADNPLPASLEVILRPGVGAAETATEIAAGLAGTAGVEEVRFNQEWLRRLESLLSVARIGGTGIAVLVFGALVFVMASVLRLAVHARRAEIEIMLLVGATPGFIRGPFLVAGLVQGILASGLALSIVEAVRRLAIRYAGDGSVTVLDLLTGHPLAPALIALLAGVGLTVSLASSYFAVRNPV